MGQDMTIRILSACNIQVIYVVVLSGVSIHGAVAGIRQENVAGTVHFCHLSFCVFDPDAPAVRISEEGSLQRGHRLRRAPHVHVLNESHRTASFRVQSQPAETRKAETQRKTFQFC
jgi:hypothetical protein